MNDKNPPEKLLACNQCGQELRICFTGRKWKVTCDTEDCARRDVYGKTKEEAIVKCFSFYKQYPAKKNCPVKYPETREFKNGYDHGFDACHDAFMAVIGKKEEWIPPMLHPKSIPITIQNCEINSIQASSQPSQCEHEWQESPLGNWFCLDCGVLRPEADEILNFFPQEIPRYKCKIIVKLILDYIDKNYRKDSPK